VPRRSDPEERRQLIAAAAARVIARQGLSAATARTIASEAGFTTGMVTHWYPSVDAIVMAALDFVAMKTTARMAAAAAEVGVDRALAAVVREALPLEQTTRDDWAVWLAFWAVGASDEAVAELQRTRYGQWIELISLLLPVPPAARAAAGEAVLDCAREVVALIDGLGVQVFFGSTTPAAAVAAVDGFLDDVAQRLAAGPRKA
jgi:AcrR family transcriptional regulator